MSDQTTMSEGTLPATGVASAAGPSGRTRLEDVPAEGFERVLGRELDAVRQGRALRRGEPLPEKASDARDDAEEGDSIARAHAARLAGLAVSGGGIRSATFNLGVLQGLARLGLLRRFDYLSVNSGGGYIGSWLSSWIRRKGLREVEQALANDACRREDRGAAMDASDLPGDADPFEDEGAAASGQEVEAGPVRFLRRFSNYLTPQLGLFSADTWTMVATYLRNLLLNLVVVILALGVILLSPRVVLLLSRMFDRSDSYGLIGGAVFFLAIAIVFIGLNLAEIFPETSHRWSWYSRQSWIQVFVVLPLFVAAWLASLWLWYSEAGALAEPGGVVAGQRDLLLGRWLSERPMFGWYGSAGLAAPEFEPLAWAFLAAIVYCGVWLVGGLFFWVSTRVRHKERPSWSGRVWRAVIVSAPLAGALGGSLIYALTAVARGLESSLAREYANESWHLLHINVWKAPGIVFIFVLTAFAHTGLMGRAFPESMRQWWSRLGAWLMIYSITWVGLFGMAIYGPILLALLGQWIFAAVTAGWAGATAAGVVVGRETAERERSERKTPGWLRKLVVSAAPQIFIVGILALVALGLHLVLSPAEPLTTTAGAASARTTPDESAAAYGYDEDAPAVQAMAAQRLSSTCGFFWANDESEAEPGHRRIDAAKVLQCHSERLFKGTTPGRTLGLLALLVGGALAFSWRVDINEFSMHLFYRNRLIQAYLGASNDDREAQPFTGFDPEDDLALADFVPENGYDGPYPIHNVTLNLVAGKELAWQERKGASFVFTPIASGFEVHEGASTKKLEKEGFRPTELYRQTEHGVTVGTAVAISGAAASPNMGAATTPAMAFLLTVFNVRLGWWLGNPRHKKTWYRMGPRVGAAALLSELFGSTDEESRYVYLSDGGHFENLAIYELIRRRCRFIVASDAGADPQSTFEDLGNAIRKCCTDFGIEIDIDTERVLRDPDDRRSLWHCAVGSIRYDKIDPGASPGVLLYLKASLTGDEARDVLTYGISSPTFPHESTADQFFGESQFESYRKLGEHVAMTVFRRADDQVRELAQEALMVRLQEAWYPPSGAADGAFTRHARQLDALFERLRESEDLRFLLQQIYPEWRVLVSQLPDRREEPRKEPELWLPSTHAELAAGFLFCHSLIQVMENVYLDLGLESEFAHPDNRGWFNLFKHWTWSGMVRATWAITAGTFGARFQNFCRRRLGFEPGRMVVEEHRLDPSGADALLTGMRADNRLNFLEESLVRELLEKNRGAEEPDRLFLLRMLVREPMVAAGEAAKELRFTFGFAVARGADLMFVRVQDHLRKMGLGRRALACLVREHAVRRVVTPRASHMPDYVRSRPSEMRVDTLKELFGSVLGDLS